MRTLKKIIALAVAVTCLISAVMITVNAGTKPGDVNADGFVSMHDVTRLQLRVADMVELSENEFENADVDGDGDLTMYDVVLIQKYIAELIKNFPIEGLNSDTEINNSDNITDIEISDTEIISDTDTFTDSNGGMNNSDSDWANFPLI